MKKWLELLVAVGEHKVGDFLEVDENVYRSYIDGGLARDGGKGPDTVILERSIAAFREEIQAVTMSLAEGITAASEHVRRASVVNVGDRLDLRESEADKSRGLGDYVRQVVRASDPRDLDAMREAHERLTKVYGVERALSEGSGTTGGYTTPVVYESQILQVAGEEEVFLPLAQDVPMAAREVEWPALDQYQAPAAGQSAYYGGVRVYRKGEAAQRTGTQPAYNKVKLIANDLTGYTEFSRDLMQDSVVTLDAQIPQLLGRAIGWRADWESFNGTGAGQMLGIYNSPALVAITRNTSNLIKYQDILKMYTRLMSSEKPFARWYVHPFTLEILLSVQDPSGRFVMFPVPTTAAEGGPMTAAPQYRLMGIPVIETEKAPVLGAANDLSLIVPRRYLHGKRAGLEIGLSEHFKWDTDQIAIRAKLRNDGKPQMLNSIILSDGVGTNKVSTIVGLAA